MTDTQVWLFFQVGLALITLWVLARVAVDMAELLKQALLAGARFLSSKWKPIRKWEAHFEEVEK